MRRGASLRALKKLFGVNLYEYRIRKYSQAVMRVFALKLRIHLQNTIAEFLEYCKSSSVSGFESLKSGM